MGPPRLWTPVGGPFGRRRWPMSFDAWFTTSRATPMAATPVSAARRPVGPPTSARIPAVMTTVWSGSASLDRRLSGSIEVRRGRSRDRPVRHPVVVTETSQHSNHRLLDRTRRLTLRDPLCDAFLDGVARAEVAHGDVTGRPRPSATGRPGPSGAALGVAGVCYPSQGRPRHSYRQGPSPDHESQRRLEREGLPVHTDLHRCTRAHLELRG